MILKYVKTACMKDINFGKLIPSLCKLYIMIACACLDKIPHARMHRLLDWLLFSYPGAAELTIHISTAMSTYKFCGDMCPLVLLPMQLSFHKLLALIAICCFARL